MTARDANLIVSIHLAKTGGNTFATILERAATGVYCQSYGPSHPETGVTLEGVRITPEEGTNNLNLFDWLLTVPSIAARRSVLQGHVNPSKMRDRYPSADFAIWLRDPIDRVLSHYTFWKRMEAESDDPLFRRFRDEDMSLEEFAAEPRVRDAQTRITRDCPIEDFAFVGITERYDRGLDLFGRMYDVDTSDVVRLNFNPERSGTDYDISGETRKVLESFNEKDQELYERAVERFETLDAETPRPGALRRRLAEMRSRIRNRVT